MSAQTQWEIRFRRMELQRQAAKIRRLTGEAKCYHLARDCYRILAEHDKAKEP